MADFGRFSHPVAESRRVRPGTHMPCPRCRIDPSHVSRQHWENRSSDYSLQGSVASASSSSFSNASVSNELRSVTNGYPDICPRAVGRPQMVPPPSVHSNRGPNQYVVNASIATPPRTTEAHSSRSGDTWRIRGVLENHPPDVTRRVDSQLGRLPDVTRHTVTASDTHHSRISGHDLQNVPRLSYSASRYPPTVDTSNSSLVATCDVINPAASSSVSTRDVTGGSNAFRDHHHQAMTPQRFGDGHLNRGQASQWKREQPSASPWVTRGQQTDQHQQSSNSTPWLSGQSSVSTTTTTAESWRPPPLPPQHVLSQCPLPDLVTPRRQARKQCCGLLAAHSVAVRWLVVAVAALGLLCSVVGTVVGVVRAAGREHLTVALLLIGLGIVLVTMSGVAWRLTSRDAPSCRAMFGLRRTRHEPHRRFVPRVPHYGRPHPFSAMLYPDIPLRPPPPSYQASMQEYRLRLLLMDRQQAPPPAQQPPPPPTYRGPATVYPKFPVNMGAPDYSRPPSYRSRPSSAGQPSPVGLEEVTPEITTLSDHPSDVGILAVLQSSSSHSSQILRLSQPAPPAGTQVEVVAQV